MPATVPNAPRGFSASAQQAPFEPGKPVQVMARLISIEPGDPPDTTDTAWITVRSSSHPHGFRQIPVRLDDLIVPCSCRK